MSMKQIDYNSFPLFNKEQSTNYLFGANNVWVSDIWAFWNYIVRQRMNKIKKPKREKKQPFLLALLEQARNFYEAAETAPIKSKPLLYYYSFMNFVKVFININIDERDAIWDGKSYMHGLQESVGTTATLSSSTVTCCLTSRDVNKINITKPLFEQLGDVVADKQVFNVEDLLAACLGIHRAYTETHNRQEKFYRLDTTELVQEGKKLTFTCKIHDCTESVARTLNNVDLYNNTISDLDNDGNHTGEYSWVETHEVAHNGYANQKELYEFATKLRKKGIWCVTNGDDVSQYLSSISSPRLSTESTIYVLMFFFGSITRYQPNLFDQLLSDKNMWLMSEFLKTQPKQFLYLMTSRFLGHNVRRSWMAKL